MITSALSRLERRYSIMRNGGPGALRFAALWKLASRLLPESFVHIDIDLYRPTRDSLEFFYPRMNDGGIIIVDDFALCACPGATRAVEEVLSGKPEQMISLPTGVAS